MTTYPFTSPLGGVMTAGRTGVLSGDLLMRVAAGAVEVAYAETDDWYPVAGGAKLPSAALDDPAALVGHLSADPGIDRDGNPRHTDLRSFRPS